MKLTHLTTCALIIASPAAAGELQNALTNTLSGIVATNIYNRDHQVNRADQALATLAVQSATRRYAADVLASERLNTAAKRQAARQLAKAKDPDARCTKNCDSMAEARAYQAGKGGRGVIVPVPGKVKACGYCPAFPICSQKDEYDLG